MKRSEDFDIPTGLSRRGRKAAQLILKLAEEIWPGLDLSGGGCRAFYTPQEWKERGEQYGHESCLIVCHDGGDLAPLFNMDYECYASWDRMLQGLGKQGFLAEQATCWYTCIYDQGGKQ